SPVRCGTSMTESGVMRVCVPFTLTIAYIRMVLRVREARGGGGPYAAVNSQPREREVLPCPASEGQAGGGEGGSLRPLAPAVAAALMFGCAATSPPSSTSAAAPPAQLGSPFGATHSGSPLLDWPVMLDRNDVGLSTSVMFRRVPTVSEIHDLDLEYGF